MTSNTSKPHILATGMNGLVGTKIAELYKDTYQFDVLDMSDPNDPIDITNYDLVARRFSAASADIVVHLAAFTNVTAAWEQTDQKDGLAYQVNVVGTENIIKACAATNKHLIHISTAYVFDGQKPEPYLETDPISPIEWYGQTKAWAEEKVQNSNIDWTILRIDQPFRLDPFPKKDVAHRIISQLSDGSLPPMFTDHFFGPTLIEDFAKVVDWIIRTKTTGLFHASSGESWTDFEFATALQQALDLTGHIKPGSLQKYLESTHRPYQPNTALNTQKLTSQLDFSLQSIESSLSSILYGTD